MGLWRRREGVPRRRWHAVLGLCVLPLWTAPLAAQPIEVEHDSVSCVVAGKYPEIDACLSPADNVARARVFFRAAGTTDWYYVEMVRETRCFRGTLPRPSDSIEHVDYYVSATDREFVETRTQEFAPRVVERESECHGTVAPCVASASVVVNAVAGAGAPAGFVGGGVLGLGLSTATVTAVGVGVAGGAAVVAGGGEDESPSPTATPPPAGVPPTPPGPPPVEPTVELPAGCLADDSAPPDVTIQQPSNNEDVGAQVEIVANVMDPGPVASGLSEVKIFAAEQGGSRSVPIQTFTPSGSTYSATWTVPGCLGPQDRWYIQVEATDLCGKQAGTRVRVRHRGESCQDAATGFRSTADLLWTSELTAPAAQGQVIVDGIQAAVVGPGASPFSVPARPGAHRVEAVLVAAEDEGGLWRFGLAAGGVEAGSLRVVAGEAVGVGPGVVTFHIAGQAGERVVFTFDME